MSIKAMVVDDTLVTLRQACWRDRMAQYVTGFDHTAGSSASAKANASARANASASTSANANASASASASAGISASVTASTSDKKGKSKCDDNGNSVEVEIENRIPGVPGGGFQKQQRSVGKGSYQDNTIRYALQEKQQLSYNIYSGADFQTDI